MLHSRNSRKLFIANILRHTVFHLFVRPRSRVELLSEPIQADTGHMSCPTMFSPPYKTKTTSQHYSHSHHFSKSMVFCYLSIILLSVVAHAVLALKKTQTEVQPKISCKLRVINATVMPTLLYVCETWTMLERHKSKVQAFEMRCLRRVEGVTDYTGQSEE